MATQKAAKSKSVEKAKKAPSKKKVVNIDYPSQGEEIMAGHYTIRVSSPLDGYVEVSVNDGRWFPARAAVGFHWFDWAPQWAGTYRIAARLFGLGGEEEGNAETTCRVISSSKN